MTNERDDEILGRALSRAIETQDPVETPYERSRIGAPRARRGTSFWRMSALAASIVIAGGLGSQLLFRPATDEPVGVQPTATVAPSGTPAATSTPAATATTAPTAIDHDRIFFARHDLPPVSVHTDKARSDGPADKRVALLLALALIEDPGVRPPAGAVDARPPQGTVTRVAGVVISGGVATADLTVPNGWRVSGSAATTALLQQLVYTATEEPGVDRLLLTENGGKRTTIDQFVWDKPLAREDVSGYSSVRYDTTSRGEDVSEVQSRPCAPNCPSPVPARLSNNYSVDTFAMGVARVVVQVDSGDWQEFKASGHATVDAKNPWSSKYVVTLEVGGTETKPGLEIVDRSPLRSIRSVVGGGKTIYELAVDDHRPWRVALLTNPDRIVIDVGGYAQAISDTVVVYSPRPGDISRQFTVTGLSRTFEGTTQWRVVDAARRVVASGFTTASRGTSAVWGTYQVSVQLPATVSGNVTLEVWWGSPRDGSEMGLAQVPLTVR